MCSVAAHTTVVDASADMLELCGTSPSGSSIESELTLTVGDWISVSRRLSGLDLVMGDNALNFLPYPGDWHTILDVLADRMVAGALLCVRILSVPGSHRPLPPAEIVQRTLSSGGPINLTAVRTALLLSQWEANTCTILPERALDVFDANRSAFDPLLCDTACPPANDLLAIEKYRGSDAVYFVPTLADALMVFERRFDVKAVMFGPYAMSQYFPLIVASKRATEMVST
jgi:hypothetical protein